MEHRASAEQIDSPRTPRTPLPGLPKSTLLKSQKSIPASPEGLHDHREHEHANRPKRFISEDEKEYETARKRSMNEEYMKYLDEFIPKGNQSISSARVDRPEFEHKGSSSNVRMIAVCGGAASGKTFIVKSIRNYLRSMGYEPTTIKERNFLLKIPCADEDLTPEIIKQYDFDSYKAIDWKLFESAVKSMSEAKPFNCPIYSLFQDKPIMKTRKLRPSNIILIEGRLFLNNEFIRNRSNLVIYLDTDSDIMLSRIIVKNQVLKKHALGTIIHKYTQFIKPNFDRYVLPTKKYADMIIYNFAGEYYSPDEVQDGFQFLTMVKDWLRLHLNEEGKKEGNSKVEEGGAK
jgi:uridine kinase